MRIATLVFLFVFCAGVFHAQDDRGTISGSVSDSEGRPLAGAIVKLRFEKTNEVFSTVTTEGGRFSFGRLAPGDYRISGEEKENHGGIALESPESSVALNKAETLELRLTLYPPIREKVNVKVSAGTVQPISEVSKTIDLIDSREIRARNEISLANTLRTVPGFRVQQLGGFGRTASIKTRGLRNQDTAVLLDGMRLRDPSSITGDASAFISDITITGFDRIEVLRGSGSSVYGTNAVGGVVDLQTAEAAKGLHGDVEGQAGGEGFKQARGTVAFSGGRLGVSSSFSRTVLSSGIDGNDDALNNGLNARADFRLYKGYTLTGRLFVTDSFVRLNTNPDTLGAVTGTAIVNAIPQTNFLPDQDDPDAIQNSGLTGSQIRFTGILGPGFLFRSGYQRLSTRRKNENGSLGPGFQPFGGTEISEFSGTIDTFFARLDWTSSPGDLLTIGFEKEGEYYRNDGNGPFPGSSFFAKANQRSSTFYLQYLASFLDRRLQIAGGSRFQFFDVGSTGFSGQNAPYQDLVLADLPDAQTYDGAVSYVLPKTGTKIRAHVGTGVRVPSLFERLGTFFSSFSQQFVALGDPGLKPERSIAFDTGVEQSFAAEKVRLSATYFYTRLTDTIGFGFPARAIGSTPRPFGGYRNEKGGIARGMEFATRFKPTPSTDLFASYTFTNSDQRAPQVAGSGVIRSLGIPEHTFTFTGTRRFGDRLTVSLDLQSTGAYLAPVFSNQSFTTVIYRFEGANRADLNARYTFPAVGERIRFNVFGSVENVFDDAYFENGFRTEGRTARIGLGVTF